MSMTEDQLEGEALGWLRDVGYHYVNGYSIAPDGEYPERKNYQQPLLVERLLGAINRLNPAIPLVAREDALKQVMDLGIPALLSANRHFHGLIVNGVPVQYQKDGETRGDFVRLIDFSNIAANEWLAVNQYTLKGFKHTRRPDIILFVNGMPLVLMELKNPADENADIWKAFDQIQTYKEQIHIWDRNFQCAQNPNWPIHDHIFSFRSVVIVGAVQNKTYELDARMRRNWRTFKVGYGNGKSLLSWTGEEISVKISNATVQHARNAYEVKAGVFHRSILRSPFAITVLACRNDQTINVGPTVVGDSKVVEVSFDRNPTDKLAVKDLIKRSIEVLLDASPVVTD